MEGKGEFMNFWDVFHMEGTYIENNKYYALKQT